jgi:adenylate cyclase
LELRLQDVVLPVDELGRMTVNYRTVRKDVLVGFSSSFPTYAAADVLTNNVPAGAFAGKIVLIGASATALKDVKATPITQDFSGVEVHATLIDNILAGDMLSNPYEFRTVHFLVIFLMALFLTFFIARGRSWLSFLVVVLVVLLLVKASLVLLERFNLVFVPAWEILAAIIIYPVLTMLKFWQEELQKKQIRDMFGTMVSATVLHYLENHPGTFSLSGQKREATMFFSDGEGFTTISETLEPEQLSNLLNGYLSPMTSIIMERGGYVDKYEGDAIMAEWGVPYPVPDHAAQACLAALEQQEKLAELRPILKAKYGKEIRVRMGLNSGTVTAGNMGSDKRFQYTVMGDAVNQAARLEPANKDYGTLIIMGEAT